ncbi:MAG TPA: MFS transporter, partial [Chloroflexota bacterium]|nr:MFS transporter [Chloroflexota bacterium]
MRQAIGRGRAAFGEVPAWRRALYWDGTIGGIYAVIFGGTVQTGIILWAGGGAFDLGLLSALTTGGGFIVLLMRLLERRYGTHKRLTRDGWTLARVAFLPLAIFLVLAGYFGAVGRPLTVPLMLLIVLLSAAAGAVGNVAWYSWVARLVPSAERGGFIAQRSRWTSVAALILFPIVGWVLDQGTALHHEGLAFASVLILPVLTGVVGWRLLNQVPDAIAAPPSTAPVRRRRHSTVPVGRFAVYNVVYQIAVYFSAPFFQAYALERLGFSFSLLTELQVVAQIFSIITLVWWGQIIDRIGLKLPLAVCSIGKGLVPLCYILATKEVWWPVIGAYVLSVLDAGINTGTGTAFAEISSGHHGSARVAHLNLL